MQVLVAEPSAPISNALKKFLDGVADVQVVHFVDEAVAALRARVPEVVIASVSGTFDGEVLCSQVRKQLPDVGVVLVFPPADFETAPRRAEAANADAFVVGPLKKHAVLSAVRACRLLRELRVRLREVATEGQKLAEKLKALPPRSKVGAGGVNTTDEAFFKKYMLLEVKRSKRYQYPVALLIVALDELDAHLKLGGTPDDQRGTILKEGLAAISELLRDIDIAMTFAEDKFIVFLPHTPRSGALVVGKRIIERLGRLASFEAGTASIGLASFDPHTDVKESVSFGGLVRQASELLKRAQGEGGDRVEATPGGEGDVAAPKKKNRISMG
jgi:PleD family two-component response regulator